MTTVGEVVVQQIKCRGGVNDGTYLLELTRGEIDEFWVWKEKYGAVSANDGDAVFFCLLVVRGEVENGMGIGFSCKVGNEGRGLQGRKEQRQHKAGCGAGWRWKFGAARPLLFGMSISAKAVTT